MAERPNYKWYILALTALTGCFAVAAPFMCLTVLFDEISTELQLNLVQIGLIWSIGSLPAIFMSMLSGAINDRLGPKRVILAATVLVSAAGAARGLATDFTSLLIVVIIMGLLAPMVTTSAFKICGLWFPGRQLGLANGVFSTGMALGFMLSSLLSATTLSAWLGGWRNVIFFYGALGSLFCIPWYFTRQAPTSTEQNAPAIVTVPLRQALSHVVKIRSLWLLGIALGGMNGCVQGMNGYIPLYLREIGWPALQADGALSLFHGMSMLFVLPIALWSDRLKARKTLLVGLLALMVLGGVLLAISGGSLVWVAVALMGMTRDASITLLITMIIETEGVGPKYAGSASGFGLLFLSIGSLIAPPLGNRLAEISPHLPFALWAGMVALGLLSLAFVKVSRRGNTPLGLSS